MAQSMASMTMAYDMINMQAMTMHKMNTVSVSTHDIATMPGCHTNIQTGDIPEQSTLKCCEQECDCSTTGCATVPLFITTMTYTPEVIISNKIALANPPLISQITTSLYRPPIQS